MKAWQWQDSLRDQLNTQVWIKGAVNYDEDLHFSTYYLRASEARATGRLYAGYSTVVAFYEGFTETYYLLREECRSSAAAIVKKALARPTWLPRVLREIERRSDLLQRIFPAKMCPSWLARQSSEALISLYLRHDRANRVLYRYARLPEALDRGVNYFTDYLMSHLQLRGLSAATAAEAFATISAPSVPSVLAQEITEFDSLVALARQSEFELLPLVRDRARDPGRSRMSLSPELLKRLELHRQKWQFLPYHGYGRRQLATLGEYIARLLDQLRSPGSLTDSSGMAMHGHVVERKRDELLQQLQIDPAHAALFRVYPEIGAAKLYRRYAQLKNFYFLDMLLAEIAQRLHVSEWTVRCMLPEEVSASLKAGRVIDDAVRERLGGCMYVSVRGQEHVAGSKQAAEFRELMQKSIGRRASPDALKGIVASRGKVAGPCRVVIRAEDVRADFPKGTILVSESTDPDLVHLLRAAGGVLTEQGGVTSHAAIICRELGVPTIIGVEGLLDRVHDGDWLEVDAELGEIRVIKQERQALPALDPAPQSIGAKAFNLGVVRSLGFHVPTFVVLDYSDVQRIASQPADGENRRLVQRVLSELAVHPGDELAVRSSAIQEDAQQGSAAGQYNSLLRISPDRLSDALAEFVKVNSSEHNVRIGAPYSGSVIVQKMIAADCAGVCLTSDARTGHAGAVIIEMAAGGNSEITGGTIRPDRVVVDRRTGDILDEQHAGSAPCAQALDVTGLVRQFLQLESRFGMPLDIEWALASQELYILQARPIVHSRAPAAAAASVATATVALASKGV